MNDLSRFRCFDAADALSVGNIVEFAFPFPSVEECRTRTKRPCLVIDVENYLEGQFAELLPGTQSLLPEPEPSDILVEERAFIASSPMRGDWRFVAALHERFDTQHPAFLFHDGVRPLLLGQAYGSSLDVITHLRGQLQSTRKLHVEYRRARRASRRRP